MSLVKIHQSRYGTEKVNPFEGIDIRTLGDSREISSNLLLSFEQVLHRRQNHSAYPPKEQETLWNSCLPTIPISPLTFQLPLNEAGFLRSQSPSLPTPAELTTQSSNLPNSSPNTILYTFPLVNYIQDPPTHSSCGLHIMRFYSCYKTWDA